MSHNKERYSSYNEMPLNEMLMKLRAEMGTLPDERKPTREEITTAVLKLFPELLEHEQIKLIDACIASEDEAEKRADNMMG